MKTGMVLMSLCLGAGLWAGCHPVPQAADAARVEEVPAQGQVTFQKTLCPLSWTNWEGRRQHDVQSTGCRSHVGEGVYATRSPAYSYGAQGTDQYRDGAWENTLSDQDIEDVVAYLRSLKD